MDDAEITRNAFLASRGDRVAAATFVSATQRQLYRLLSYLSNANVAEDLVQETYLRAFAALPRFAGRAPARMWLLAIAKHVAADHLRGHRRQPKISPAEDWVLAAEHSGASVADHGRLVVLRRLVAELDEERREALVLTQVLGLSYAEAAEVCACAVGTIRSRVSRAREDLAVALTGRGTDTTASHG